MELRMTAAGPEDLPEYDREITTGPMGDCVSVIVLWGLNALNPPSYENMRGSHGMGGIEAIDFDALFAGVPNQPLTQVIVVASRQASGVDLAANDARPAGEASASWTGLLERVRGLIASRLRMANIRIATGYNNASVNRQGILTRV